METPENGFPEAAAVVPPAEVEVIVVEPLEDEGIVDVGLGVALELPEESPVLGKHCE
jgi:hypothetical protein